MMSAYNPTSSEKLWLAGQYEMGSFSTPKFTRYRRSFGVEPRAFRGWLCARYPRGSTDIDWATIVQVFPDIIQEFRLWEQHPGPIRPCAPSLDPLRAFKIQ